MIHAFPVNVMRIECVACDTMDGDYVLAVPDGWEDVDTFRSLYKDEYPFPDYWATHFGTCPDCVQRERRERGELF